MIGVVLECGKSTQAPSRRVLRVCRAFPQRVRKLGQSGGIVAGLDLSPVVSLGGDGLPSTDPTDAASHWAELPLHPGAAGTLPLAYSVLSAPPQALKGPVLLWRL